jgi:hypothetical protein
VTKYWASVCNGQPDPLLNIVWWSGWVRRIRVGHSPSEFIYQFNSLLDIVCISQPDMVSNIVGVLPSDSADTE